MRGAVLDGAAGGGNRPSKTENPIALPCVSARMRPYYRTGGGLLGEKMNETKQEQPEKMLTLVALVRMPERVARGLRAGDASLAWWCGEAVGCSWEGEWDSDPDAVKWQKEIAERWGCGPEDRETMRGHDAGFVEAGSEAEAEIRRLLTMRADADAEGAA